MYTYIEKCTAVSTETNFQKICMNKIDGNFTLISFCISSDEVFKFRNENGTHRKYI